MPRSSLPLAASRNFNSSDMQDNPTQWPVVQATAQQPVAESNHARASSFLSRRGGGGSPDHLRSPSAPLAMAKLCEKRGQLDEAQRIYSQLLKTDDRNPLLYHRLGVVLARQGDFSNAARHFQAAAQLNPRDPDLLCDMAYAAYLEGQLDDAESLLRQTLKIDANHRKAWNNLGLVLGAQGQDAEALKCFQRIGNEAEALANLAYAQGQRGAFHQAQSTYLRSLSLDNHLTKAAKAMLQVADREHKAMALAASQESPEADLEGASPASPAILTPDKAARPLAARQAVAPAAATGTPTAIASQVTSQKAASPVAPPASPAAPAAPAPVSPAPVSVVLQIVAPANSVGTAPVAPAAFQVVPQGVAPAPAVPAAAVPVVPPGVAYAPAAAGTVSVDTPAPAPIAVVASPVAIQAVEQAEPTAYPQEKSAKRMVGRRVISPRVPHDLAPHPSPVSAATTSAASGESSRTTFSDFDGTSPTDNSKPVARRVSDLHSLR